MHAKITYTSNVTATANRFITSSVTLSAVSAADISLALRMHSTLYYVVCVFEQVHEVVEFRIRFN